MLILIDGLSFHRIVEKIGGDCLVLVRDSRHEFVRHVGGRGAAGTFSSYGSFLNSCHNLKWHLPETVVLAGRFDMKHNIITYCTYIHFGVCHPETRCSPQSLPTKQTSLLPNTVLLKESWETCCCLDLANGRDTGQIKALHNYTSHPHNNTVLHNAIRPGNPLVIDHINFLSSL